MDRKKELKMQYREMRPPMGIYMIRSKSSNKCFIEATQDLKSRINRAKFQLGAGSHPNKELQQEWNEYGTENFTIEIIENLEYDKKDEAKTDYSEDLALLQMIYEERLTKQNIGFYKMKL
jgi:hypothetical protein